MSEAVNTGSWFDKVKMPTAWGKIGGGGDLSAMPFLRRFAGSLRGVNPVKQNAIVQSALVPFDISGRLNEGEHPIRAVGRPLVQLGGGLGGGTVGGLLGFPTTGLGGFATTAAGATGGYHGAGALFDQVFPKGQVNQRLGDYGRNFSKGANFLFNEYLLGLPTGSSTKPSIEMANIPVGTKEAELEMRQEQGGYIPPGMGVPTQSGGVQSLYDSDRAAWLAKTANSPAQQSGAWDSAEGREQLWQQHLMNQDFQQAKETGTLEDFATKYPNSQTAQRMNWDPRQGRRF